MPASDEYERVCAVVLQALEFEGLDRSEFLDRECGEDSRLRQEVDSLLAQDAEADEFLDQPIVDLLSESSADESDSASSGRVRTLTFNSSALQNSVVAPVERVRHYQVVREIGRGGMGVVYEGRDGKLDRRVAIKAIHWDSATDQKRRDRFRQEARLLAALNHTNIGQIYSLEETDDGDFLILEFVEGQTLGQLIAAGETDVQGSIDLAQQVAAALEAAHERGIVHRDLSPGNVMVRHDGVAKVLDFGLARSTGVVSDTHTMSSGPIVGTPSFMSPELLRGAPSSRAADSWAFACLLYESLTGQRAFKAPTLPGIFDQILHGRVDLDLLPADAPASVRTVIERCWKKQPEQRLDDMGKIREFLTGASVAIAEPLAESAIDHWAASVQPLSRSVDRGDSVLLRLYLENPEKRDSQVTIVVEDDASWSFEGRGSSSFVLPAGEAREVLFAVIARGSGARRLPTFEVVVPSGSRTLTPSPSAIEVGPVEGECTFGRETELLGLEAKLEHARYHCGELFVIHGEDGAGRSTMLREVEQRAIRRNVRTVWAIAHQGLQEPLELLLDLVRSFLGVFEPLSGRDARIAFAREKLHESLGESSPAGKYFLELLRGIESELQEGSMQYYRAYQLFSAFAKSSPVVFLIDDLDHADPRSLEILESILRRARADGIPISAMVTHCSSPHDSNEDSGAAEAFLSSDLVTETIGLRPLSTAAVDALIERRFPGAHHRDYLPRLASAIIERTEGRPGPIREALRFLARSEAESALFRHEASGWVVDPAVDPEARLSELPATYSELLEERLASVAEASRSTLEVAALCGTEFGVAVLEEVVESNGGGECFLDDALDDLEAAGIVEPIDADLSRYRFAYPTLVAQVVSRVDARGSRRAARLRQRVATALVAQYESSQGRAGDAEALGLSLIALGQLERARPYLLHALGQRVKRREGLESNRIVRRIGELESEASSLADAERYEWLSLRGKALVFVGKLELAQRAVEEARQLAERLGQRSDALRSMVLLAEIAIRRGRFEAGRDLALASRETALESGLSEVVRDANRNLAVGYRRLGDRDAAGLIWREDLEHAISIGDELGEIRGQNNLGILDYERRDLDQAEERFVRAAQLAKSLDHVDEMIPRVWIANIAFERGQLEAARAGYEKAIGVYQNLQNRRALSRNYFNLGRVEFYRGEFSAALSAFERASELCGELKDGRTEAGYRVEAALCALEAGQNDRAQAELVRAQQLQPNSRELAYRISVGAIERGLGNFQEAEALVREVEEQGGYAAIDAFGLDDESRFRLLAIVIDSRPDWVHDADFMRDVVLASLDRSEAFGDVRERVQLAAAVLRARGHLEFGLEEIEALTGDDLSVEGLARWARSSVLGEDLGTHSRRVTGSDPSDLER